MADNRLRVKAMNNYWSGLGFYAPNTGEIETTPENSSVSEAQKPNPKKKHVMVGKTLFRISGA